MISRPTAAATLVAALLAVPCLSADKPQAAGPTDDGFLLPNGWTISPAGRHVELADMPLNIVPLADGHSALVASSGYNRHELCLVDLADVAVKSRTEVHQSWFGIATDPGQKSLWWSGGGA